MAVVDQKYQQLRWFFGVGAGVLGGLLVDLIFGGTNTLLATGIGAILGSGWAVGVNSRESLEEIDIPDFEVEYEEIALDEGNEPYIIVHEKGEL